MRRFLFLLFFTTTMVSFLLVSCHTETPTSIDFQDPTGNITYVYDETDTLVYYDSESTMYYAITSDSVSSDTTDFEDFTVLFDIHNSYTFELSASDNQIIYKASLFALDTADNEVYEIKSVTYPSNNEKIQITVNYLDFTGVPNFLHTDFQFHVKIYDESENQSSTSSLGISTERGNILDIFYKTFGILTEVDGDQVDFRDKIGKLNVIQFYGYG